MGKGALITGPRVREKTAENRSLQLFRAAEQNRLPPVSSPGAEPTAGAALLCQHFPSGSSTLSRGLSMQPVPAIAPLTQPGLTVHAQQELARVSSGLVLRDLTHFPQSAHHILIYGAAFQPLWNLDLTITWVAPRFHFIFLR